MKFNGKSVERIGLFTKTYGNKGAIEFSPDDSRIFNEKEWVFVDVQQEFIPFFVESVLPRGKKLIARLRHIINLNQAENLTKKPVFVHKKDEDKKPMPSLEDFFGFLVIDKKTNNELGIFTSISDEQANPLMIVSGDKEILVPLNGDFISKIDSNRQQIFLNLPEGFLEIY
ncbi:MAG: hypothetical protein J7L46_00145 [Bacteroidales bacterium]|nr:hypothetical protein [Bacteroidales bacterium]